MDLLILVSLYRPSIIIIIISVMYFRPAGLSGKQEWEEGGWNHSNRRQGYRQYFYI